MNLISTNPWKTRLALTRDASLSIVTSLPCSTYATPKSVNVHVDGSQSWRGQWAPRWWGLLPPPRTCPSPRPVTGGCHRHRSWSNRLTESVLLGPTFSPAAIPRSLLLLQFVTDFRSSVSSYFWPVLVENIVGIGVVVLPNSFLPRLWLWYVLRVLLVYDFLIFGIFGFLSDTVRDLSFESCSRCDVVERRARVSVSIFLVSREVLFSLECVCWYLIMLTSSIHCISQSMVYITFLRLNLGALWRTVSWRGW